MKKNEDEEEEREIETQNVNKHNNKQTPSTIQRPLAIGIHRDEMDPGCPEERWGTVEGYYYVTAHGIF